MSSAATYGDLTAANLVDAVIAGDLVMGYTDPFASSTGLNFLLTVLDTHRRGRRSAPDVSRRRQRVRAVPAPGSVRGLDDAADARLGRERHRHTRHLRHGVADLHQHRVAAVGLRVHPVRRSPRQPAVRRRRPDSGTGGDPRSSSRRSPSNPSSRSWPSSTDSTRRRTPPTSRCRQVQRSSRSRASGRTRRTAVDPSPPCSSST